MSEGKKNNRKEEGCPPPVWRDSSSPDFSVPQCPHLCFLCFRHGSIPFPAPSISHSPEGQPTEVYISKTGAGHAQTPRTGFFSATNFGSSPTLSPKGQAGPHRSLGVSKREKIIPLRRWERGRGVRWAVRGSAGSNKERSRGWRALGRRAVRGPRQRARPSEGALSEGTCAGARAGSGPPAAGGAGRGGEGRGRGGARTPISAGLLEAAARPRVGGQRPSHPEPPNPGLWGTVRDARRGTRPWGRAARRCLLLRFPR